MWLRLRIGHHSVRFGVRATDGSAGRPLRRAGPGSQKRLFAMRYFKFPKCRYSRPAPTSIKFGHVRNAPKATVCRQTARKLPLSQRVRRRVQTPIRQNL